ncbi:SWIM zinc finger family protein [Halorussus halophilus]|uniref:SWIM zinc finger family protein n=1 Tax=Halorussus halophilus TaxID=2650975 RepID=UPI0013017353|nr:SWIM zinc finger family protein [Halorussus halophilus]
MTTNPLEQLDVTNRTLKRAQYEALTFSLASDGIQVRNNSHATPSEHVYLVEVTDGVPTSCTCPADEQYSGACKHRIAVAIRRPILDVVARQQLVADGGVETRPQTRSETESDEKRDWDCDCADLPDDFPCWECYRRGERELPSNI